MPRRRRVIVGVVWIDTQAATDNHRVIPIPMVTFGEVIADEPGYIRLTNEIHADGGCRDCVAIPKGVIRAIVRVGSMLEPAEFAEYRTDAEAT